MGLLLHLMNLTPFVAEKLILPDAQGAETLLVVVKGTFDLNKSPPLPLPPEKQAPVELADRHAGDPATTSVAAAADIALHKPAADVLLQGSAFGGGREQVDVTLRIGPINKTLRVSGDRVWQSFLGMASLPRPQPFDRIPLVYERAFGGTDASNPDAPGLAAMNPVGVGFRAAKSKAPIVGAPAPNIERPDSLFKRPNGKTIPGGFGPIAAGWEPRVKYAGTYDEKWQKEVCPLLPDDFNPRFYQAAPEDQILPGYIQGGETVEVVNATPSGTLRFTVPVVKLSMLVQVGMDDVPLTPRCDTLAINTDLMQLTLVWRATHVVHGRIPEVRWIRVQQEGWRG